MKLKNLSLLVLLRITISVQGQPKKLEYNIKRNGDVANGKF